jgi:hypothetical protein
MGFKINRVRCVSVEERAAYVGALRRLPDSVTNCLMLLSPRRAPAEGGAGYNSGRRRDRRDCGANFGRMMPAQQEACADRLYRRRVSVRASLVIMLNARNAVTRERKQSQSARPQPGPA